MEGGKDHLMFLRSDEKQRLLIVASFSAEPQKIDWPSGLAMSSAMAKDLLTNELHAADQPLSLASHQVLWLELG